MAYQQRLIKRCPGIQQIGGLQVLSSPRRINRLVFGMAHTVRNEEEKKQFFDSPDVLEDKIEKLAQLIRTSSHFISFTGAGISTSTGIPDYRSGKDTILPTGPGAWEKEALGINPKVKLYVPSAKAKPSPTHMSLVTLQQYGILRYLVSQNTDGLHLRSGFPSDFLAELHGNTNLQVCKQCGSKFLRDFRTRKANGVFEHETHRTCQKCQGPLYDTIVNFGQQLPQDILGYALNHGACSDLCLVLGSSLTVNPAAMIPTTAGKNGNLVIVNLQSTPLDKLAAIKINAMCDDVMKRVMEKLGIPISLYTLKRHLELKKLGNQVVHIRGIDASGNPYSFLKTLKLKSKGILKVDQNREPFIMSLEKDPLTGKCILDVDLVFYGHYKEPDFNIRLNLEQSGDLSHYLLEYDVYKEKWIGMNPYKLDYGVFM